MSVGTKKYCAICQIEYDKRAQKYHSTEPSLTHISNAYKRDLERIGKGEK